MVIGREWTCFFIAFLLQGQGQIIMTVGLVQSIARLHASSFGCWFSPDESRCECLLRQSHEQACECSELIDPMKALALRILSQDAYGQVAN